MADMNRRAFGLKTLIGVAGLALGAPAQAAAARSRQPDAPRAFRYIHLDVFTDRRLQGNQLFVFTQPAGLDTETMQTMTRESNLSECTFVFPPEQAGTENRVRIFTRTPQTPFAGHPTIGPALPLGPAGGLEPGGARTPVGLRGRPVNPH